MYQKKATLSRVYNMERKKQVTAFFYLLTHKPGPHTESGLGLTVNEGLGWLSFTVKLESSLIVEDELLVTFV